MKIHRAYRRAMNQTEAWEAVWQAAALYCAENKGVKVTVLFDQHDGTYGKAAHDLMKALTKTGPKVLAMRRRLQSTRATVKARKKAAQGMPAWLERATR